MPSEKELRNQKILSATICIMLFFSPASLFVNLLLEMLIGRAVSFDSMLLYVVLLSFLLSSLVISLKKIKLSTMLIPMILLLAYVISYALHPDTNRYMFTAWTDLVENTAYWLFINSLPAFIIIRRIWNYELLLQYLRRFSLVSVGLSLGILIMYLSMDSQPSYMSFSYDILSPTVFLMYGFFSRRKPMQLVFALLGGFMMFFCGARGPILCMLAATVIYVLFLSENHVTKFLTVLFSLLLILCMTLFWDSVLRVLYQISEAIGVSSRTIEKLVEGTVTDDSGRGDVRMVIASEFSVFGSGLYGDRALTGGRYSHNLFMEILIQYGLLFGALIVVAILVLILSGFFTKDKNKKQLFLVFLSSGFIKLMVTSSYLSKEPAFYCLLGICLSCICNDEMYKADSLAKLLPDEEEKKKKGIIRHETLLQTFSDKNKRASSQSPNLRRR